MEREIIFRGYRKHQDEWAYGSLIVSDDCTSIWSNDLIDDVEVIPETVGQYTGLNDKNGKRIFEGDIVKFDYNIGNLGRFARILFEDGEYRYRVFTNADDLYNCRICGENDICCVIGNIHENPELLKEE